MWICITCLYIATGWLCSTSGAILQVDSELMCCQKSHRLLLTLISMFHHCLDDYCTTKMQQKVMASDLKWHNLANPCFNSRCSSFWNHILCVDILQNSPGNGIANQEAIRYLPHFWCIKTLYTKESNFTPFSGPLNVMPKHPYHIYVSCILKAYCRFYTISRWWTGLNLLTYLKSFVANIAHIFPASLSFNW